MIMSPNYQSPPPLDLHSGVWPAAVTRSVGIPPYAVRLPMMNGFETGADARAMRRATRATRRAMGCGCNGGYMGAAKATTASKSGGTTEAKTSSFDTNWGRFERVGNTVLDMTGRVVGIVQGSGSSARVEPAGTGISPELLAALTDRVQREEKPSMVPYLAAGAAAVAAIMLLKG